MNYRIAATLSFTALLVANLLTAQSTRKSAAPKNISPDLFGVFFEDISYAADGGLYAELIQNRSFEYAPADRNGWNNFTSWSYVADGFAYGNVSVETSEPLHVNNPHYVVVTVDEEAKGGVGLSNEGYDGIVVKAGSKYNFSFFARQLSPDAMPVSIELRSKKGTVLGSATLSVNDKQWKQYTATLSTTETYDTVSLVVLAKAKGKIAFDMVSLFPQDTFNERNNGMRADLAEAIRDLHPKFMRFPGGCLTHGDGLANMYRWKNTIGPVEQRVEQRNIWNYHQSVGLGYFEYFQFCEDIGAKPLPVVAAGVSCQNSGGTWRIGGTGQKALTEEETKAWAQDILDLIEWANGPATSTWGAKRAAAGHPQPFHLQYIGIGNEDKQTDAFRDRFTQIYNVVKNAHPEITIVGTVGPAPKGEDYDLGWQFANKMKIPVVDEHYYEKPDWFLNNGNRYEHYDRAASKVYVGEYASWGNTMYNAIAEAAYMTSLERNGDVVQMASYAPMLANQHHISWNPDLIYFTNTAVNLTVNYYVQQLFSQNEGSVYYPGIVAFVNKQQGDTTVAASCVKDEKSGDVILKIVNAAGAPVPVKADLSSFSLAKSDATLTILSGEKDAKNSYKQENNVVPKTSTLAVKKQLSYNAPPYSLTVIRIKTKR